MTAIDGKRNEGREGSSRKSADAVATIVEQPSYKLAEEDIAFLAEDSMRGLRLQLEYLKPEFRLSQREINHTVVVFGSARTADPDAAEREVKSAEAAASTSTNSEAAHSRLKAALQARQNSRYYTIARELGRIVGKASLTQSPDRLVVTTGGGPGIMEAVHRGAHDVGAESVGLNIVLPNEQLPNAYITPELCFRFRYFALRKLHFLHRARALVAFPGGFGTLDELFETLTLVSTGKIAPLPIILVGEKFWRQAIDFDFLFGEGVLTEDDRKTFCYCETAEAIWRTIQEWYATRRPMTNSRAE